MGRDWLRQLDERWPALAQWAGGRLDIEVPAFLMSLIFHVLILTALAMVSYRAGAELQRNLQVRILDAGLQGSDLTTLPYQDLDQSAKPPSPEPAAGTFSPQVATTVTLTSGSTLTAPDGQARSTNFELAKIDAKRATEALVPTATILGERVSIRGNGAEHVGGVEGAVDRIAQEILRRLEQDRTLVIWAFDASGSLQAERERLAKHIETVYTHVLQRGDIQHTHDGGLLTMVVAFGHDRKAMLHEPTSDPTAIVSAIDSVSLDSTGIESTFQTVAEIAHRWGKYRDSQGHFYQPMIIVVTDEVGDDDALLEDTIRTARSAHAPVYVLGSQALFGRVEGYMDYTDPKTKRTYYHLPVRQGPESAMLEQIRLPFWYAGPQYDILDSGFGPFALSRLAGATGGIYFVTRLGASRISFDPDRMREYKPDWVSRNQYEAAIAHHPLRQAVLQAAQITQQRLPGQPTMNFPPVEDPAFKEVMERNQAVAARTSYTVDAALEPINAVVRQRDHETSRRWQAQYDLIRGRLLAMKIRSYEYNWVCARMKKDAPKFQKSDSNAWRLVPHDKIQYSEKAAAAAQEAGQLLEKVVKDHPATPWALLAQRELKDKFGFRWVETYNRPFPRNRDSGNAAKKRENRPPPSKPPAPPKL
jgi:hypothetical protein